MNEDMKQQFRASPKSLRTIAAQASRVEEEDNGDEEV